VCFVAVIVVVILGLLVGVVVYFTVFAGQKKSDRAPKTQDLTPCLIPMQGFAGIEAQHPEHIRDMGPSSDVGEAHFEVSPLAGHFAVRCPNGEKLVTSATDVKLSVGKWRQNDGSITTGIYTVEAAALSLVRREDPEENFGPNLPLVCRDKRVFSRVNRAADGGLGGVVTSFDRIALSSSDFARLFCVPDSSVANFMMWGQVPDSEDRVVRFAD